MTVDTITTHNELRMAAEEASITQKTFRILAVDDEELNLDILSKHLTKAGYQTVLASSGQDAWNILSRDKDAIDVVLLDRMMPGMDGLELLRKIKADPFLNGVPVIMQTAAVGSEAAVECIEAGAYYYVTKPYAAEMLLSIVAAAAKDSQEVRSVRKNLSKRDEVLPLIDSCHFSIQTPAECRLVANYLALFMPDPARALVALTGLISNAIEHGNLGIGLHLKQDLLISKGWDREITSRLAMPQNQNKRVDITYTRDAQYMTILIKDTGEGFHWQEYMDFEPSRMRDPNGRGIAMANIMNPGSIEYNTKGNEVTFRGKTSGKVRT